jgi:uncharacterized damage-inducible protein DinB
MNAIIIAKLLQRDLEKLKQELLQYRDETLIWKTVAGISNSAGNLCLHLVGNLNTYIGAELGQSGYIRNRELEFSQKDIPREELIQKLEGTIEMVTQTLDRLPAEALAQEYPLLVLKEKTSTGYFLTHLAVHLGYHLGQINYHRRILEGA